MKDQPPAAPKPRHIDIGTVVHIGGPSPHGTETLLEAILQILATPAGDAAKVAALGALGDAHKVKNIRIDNITATVGDFGRGGFAVGVGDARAEDDDHE